jgi:hypothetical protein
MPSLSADVSYQTLLTDITDIYSRAFSDIELAKKKILNRAYWNIGRRIVNEEQKNPNRADYGDKVIVRLSQDLTASLGKGFSVTNLKYMRQYYKAFPIGQTSDQLPWSSYQLLSTIKDNKTREDFEERAIKNEWSVRDLKNNLSKEGVDVVAFSDHVSEDDALAQTPAADAELKENRGLLYTYKIRFAPVDESREQLPMIDCGFALLRRMPEGSLEHGYEGMIVEALDGELTRTEARESELYTYKAQLERVIDGDTIIAVIEVGFGNWVRQTLRLRGIDCPELTVARGQLAAQYVERELKSCPFIVVKTYRSDKYDRYLTDVFYDKREQDPVKVAAEGRFLNARLLEESLAVRV